MTGKQHARHLGHEGHVGQAFVRLNKERSTMFSVVIKCVEDRTLFTLGNFMSVVAVRHVDGSKSESTCCIQRLGCSCLFCQ